MTKAVEVYPGDTLMLSRKITEDWFLLKPTPSVKQLVGFLVLYWADRHDCEVLAIIILGNHLHIIYRHLTGRGPAFCRDVLHWIARIMNIRLGRTGKSYFAPGPCRPMRCLTPADIENELDYVVSNAPQHGICPNSYDWPGLLFGPENVGERRSYKRPPELAGSNVFPERVSITVPAPHHLRHLPDHEIHEKFKLRRKAIEADEYKERNGEFIGVDEAMTVPKFSKPSNPKKSDFKPFFTSYDPQALAAAKQSRATFIATYDARLDKFRKGDRNSDWPPGTYKMRKTYGLPP